MKSYKVDMLVSKQEVDDYNKSLVHVKADGFVEVLPGIRYKTSVSITMPVEACMAFAVGSQVEITMDF